jgi:hypothetical protein
MGGLIRQVRRCRQHTKSQGSNLGPRTVEERHHRPIGTYHLPVRSHRDGRQITLDPLQLSLLDGHLGRPCRLRQPAHGVRRDVDTRKELEHCRHLLEGHPCPQPDDPLDQERGEVAGEQAEVLIQGEKARPHRPGRRRRRAQAARHPPHG